MVNGSTFDYIILSGYLDLGHIRYFYFSLALLLYLMIIFANMLLISVICVERTLHEPMYLFLCSLSVNELYGSTGQFPALLLNILSDTHEVPLSFCYLQIFCLYTYAMVELNNLAVMSYDRYISICFPLQYSNIMTPKKVCMLISLLWLYCLAQFTSLLSLTVQMKLCGNVIDKVWCDNYMLVRLACSSSPVSNIYGLYLTVLCFGVPMFLVLYSYVKILKICWNATKERKHKAMSTCAPHIATLLNFSLGCFLVAIQSRLENGEMPSVLHLFVLVYFLACQSLFSPVIYGLRVKTLRNACIKILRPVS